MEKVFVTNKGKIVYRAEKGKVEVSVPVGMTGYEFMLFKNEYAKEINKFKERYGKNKKHTHRSRKYRRRS